MSNGIEIVAKEINDLPVGINMIIQNERGEILLGLRAGRRAGAGTWGLIGEKLKIGETIEQTAQRGLKEEINVDADIKDLSVVNLANTISSPTIQFLQIGVLVKNIEFNQIKNNESDKCAELKFFALDKMPDNLFIGTKGNIELFIKNELYNPKNNYDYKDDPNA